tara:strand:+ start:57494 stop:57913 length:420 start_codon:yes stop_codon:yes gene_type:complete
MNAIDTNVWVYSIDYDEPQRRQQAIELLNQLGQKPESTVMPWQVASEYLNCLRRHARQGQITEVQVVLYLTQAVELFPLVTPSESVLRTSLDLSSRYSLSHWDSMLLAACIDAGVDTLYSEDLDAGMTYDTVTVVNPFA